MNPNSEKKIRRIERMSVALRGLSSVLLVVIGVSTLVASGAAIAGRLASFRSFGNTINLAAVAPGARIAVALAVLATGAIVLKALLHLRNLFGNYARREIFTADSARQLRRFGFSCVLWFGVELLWVCLPGLLQTPAAPVPLSCDALFIGVVIIGVSWFTEMAAELREENDLTI